MSKELMFSLTRKDFEFDTFRAGGKGGQNQNKRDTGARCRHLASGAVGEARDGRSQKENKRAAFKRCCESKEFQTWCQVKASGLRPIDDVVDEMMSEENLKVEYL